MSATVLQKAMTEEQLLQAVTQALTLYGWRWTHSRRSDKAITMGHAGVPDVLAVKGAWLLALELKTERGHVTPDQQAWLDAFEKIPLAQSVVLRPSDLDWFIEEVIR